MAGQPKTGRRKVSNLMALSLLSLLMERPMYPYEMASKLREYGKDQAIKINWGSLYTVVQNLEKHGFIEAVEIVREGRQPERTTYRITDTGRAELKDWLRELLSVPQRGHTSFDAALGEVVGRARGAQQPSPGRAGDAGDPTAPAVPHQVGVLPGASQRRTGLSARGGKI